MINTKNFQMLVLVASIFLSGCGGSAQRLKQKKESSSFFVPEDPKKFMINTQLDIANAQVKAADDGNLSYDQIQSQLIDIPVPFSTSFIKAQRVKKKRHEQGVFAQFESALELKEVVTFYEREMELYGWICTAKYVGEESVFIFEKPNKSVIVLVQSNFKKNKNAHKVIIFL